MKTYIINGLIVLIIITGLFYLTQYTLNKQSAKSAATTASWKDLKTGEKVANKTDWWHNPFYVLKEETNDGVAIMYTVRSAGRDAKLNTADDLLYSKIDLNKSKIVGKYVGKKAKQIIIGWKEGIKEKSKFNN